MTTELNDQVVRHVAHLAKLELTDDEVRAFVGQLGDVLDYFRQLDEVDTTNVPPTMQSSTAGNVLREDARAEPWSQEQALAAAPDEAGGMFRVPKVLDQEDA